MELAQVVKKRTNCLRNAYGSLIVKDFRIISTGYVGTPHGIKNCLAGGCERCARREKGEIKTHEYQESCICIHAEQNAINNIENIKHAIINATKVFLINTLPAVI